MGWAEGGTGKRNQPRTGGGSPSPGPSDTEKKTFSSIKSKPLTPPWVRPRGLESTGSAFDAIQSQTSQPPAPSRPRAGPEQARTHRELVRRTSCPTLTERRLQGRPRPAAGGTGSLSCPHSANAQRRGRGHLSKKQKVFYKPMRRTAAHDGVKGEYERGFKEEVS